MTIPQDDATRPRTLYLDTDVADVRLEGPSLLIRHDERAPERVPIRRLGRAVIRGEHATADLLRACLALAAAGVVVHFSGQAERPALRLQTEQPPATAATDELAGIIADYPGLGPYHWWVDAQQRHAWSLVFRRGFRGDYWSACVWLERYLQRIGPGHCFPAELADLDRGLRLWLGAELHRRGWEGVVHALAARGERLEAILHRCLHVPLLWRFVAWRRQQPRDLPERERIRFLELETASRVPDQLHRHLRALASEYHASLERRRRETTDG